MRDFRKELEEGCCKPNHGCNAASVCLCGIIEDAADEIDRLRKIEAAARALKFSAYPAHGSGFVIQVSGGNINDLEAALNNVND